MLRLFGVDQGDRLGLIGPNGSGKSTLIQLLLRLRQPDSGSYLLNGIDAGEIDALRDAIMDRAVAMQARLGSQLRRMDANGDGTVSAEEFRTRTLLFDLADRDGDGQISRSEWQAFADAWSGALLPALPEPADGALVRIANIGCGGEQPFWGFADRVQITRIDLDEAKEPDIRADVRRIPVPDQAFDMVHSRHVLEHFGRAELVPLVKEWVRILRVGGELRLNVPNARTAMEWLLRMDDGEAEPNAYPSWQLYGRQDDERDYHKNWFTPRRLQLLLEMPALGLTDINVVTVNDGQNIQATATRSIQAFRVDGMLKLYIGAPITTMSAARNCSSTCSASAASAASALASELLRRCGTGLASRSR